MEKVIEPTEAELTEEDLLEEDGLTQGQQALLDMLKERHDLEEEATFAMWLRVPLMRSKQKFALAAFVVITPILWLTLGTTLPLWALAVITAVGALSIGAFAERDVVSFGSDGAKLHKPVDSKLDAGVSATIVRDGSSKRSVLVNGVSYAASEQALDTVTELLDDSE